MIIPSDSPVEGQYATVDDLLLCSDLPEKVVTMTGWKKEGEPLKLRVRGLSLEQREKVKREALDRDGTTSLLKLITGYLREGIIEPRLTSAQAGKLIEKHAGTVERLADYISTLTELDHELIEAQALALAGVSRNSEPTSQAADRESGD